MASQIDASKPDNNGALISKEIRDNFVAAKSEIEALQNNPSVAALDFTELGAMRYGGEAGAATELLSTADGRALLSATLSEQKTYLGIRADLIMGVVTDAGDDLIVGAVNA